MGKSILLLTIGLLCGCTDPIEESSEPIRGLRTYVVSQATESIERRYPTLIQPHDESPLAFEVSGQLSKVTLKEGQHIGAGEALLALDPTTFNLRVEEATAAVDQAEAALRHAQTNFARQSDLWKSRVIARAGFDDAQTTLDTTQAQVTQANRRLDIAKDNLGKTHLQAPFDGVIARIEVDSFATIAAGQRTLTLYAENAFEVSFSVPSSIINTLSLGQRVTVHIVDLQAGNLQGRISEIGTLAEGISAFPIVAVIDNPPPDLRSGMAAEAVIEVRLAENIEGFVLPITCFAFNAVANFDPDNTDIPVFVYNDVSQTVSERMVGVVGVRDNTVIVRSGLKAGEQVASAGVSYLRDGQRVVLLDNP